jgi:hypothetical protein
VLIGVECVVPFLFSRGNLYLIYTGNADHVTPLDRVVDEILSGLTEFRG